MALVLQARGSQVPPPGEWRVWLLMAGRGFGKTRIGAQWVSAVAEADPDARIALVAANLGEARSIMIEGESGLLCATAPWRRPDFEPSLRPLCGRTGRRRCSIWRRNLNRCAGRSTATPVGQSQKETTVNEALLLANILLHPVVQETSASAPATPTVGACWIVGTSAVGAFAGREDTTAAWPEGGWRFIAPHAGLRVHDASRGAS